MPKFELIAGWKQAWRMYSVWAIVLLGMLPEIYNAVLSSGLLDGTEVEMTFSTMVKIIALAGVLARLFKQAKLQAAIKQDEAAAKAAG